MPMKKHENILVFYKKAPTYNPQMVEGKPYVWKAQRSGGVAGGMTGESAPIDNKGTRYPSSIIRVSQERGLHPTQKPVELMSYLIRTFTNPGDVVLDCTMGSGTTGVAALKASRQFVGIEINVEYFELASRRISEEL